MNQRGWLAMLSLSAVTIGLWLERPSLALIVPGGVVFLCLVWSHLSGATVPPTESKPTGDSDG